MTMPVEVHFHGLEKSAAVEQRVRDKVDKLARHFDRMTHCRVVVEAPHRNPQRPKVYQIKIEVGVPGRSPVIVSHEREARLMTYRRRSVRGASWSAVGAGRRPTATTRVSEILGLGPGYALAALARIAG